MKVLALTAPAGGVKVPAEGFQSPAGFRSRFVRVTAIFSPLSLYQATPRFHSVDWEVAKPCAETTSCLPVAVGMARAMPGLAAMLLPMLSLRAVIAMLVLPS